MAAKAKPSPRIDDVALVTGAGGRIGATIARRLAGAGYKVVVHYRSSADGAKAVKAEIERAGGKAALVKGDLASRKQRATIIERAAAAFGPLTLLVNNASTFERDAVMDLDEALWDQHFGIHVEAPVFLSRDFARQLPEGAQGNIVNIIDERVLHTAPSFFSYTLSKSALWSATRTLAQSLAPRIRVNAIGPGPTLRNIRQSDADFSAQVDGLILKRGPALKEFGETIRYFWQARSVTGQMVALDGGQHLAWQTPDVTGMAE